MPRLGRDDWIDAALVALAEGGARRLSVEGLAARLGVTKGSFYWHFKGHAELVREVLSAFEARGTRAIIERVDAAGADPAARLHALSEIALTPPPAVGTSAASVADRVELAVRAWAGSDELAAETLARVDRQRMDYVSALLVASGRSRADARLRAEIFYRILIGEYVWRSHGGAALSPAARTQVADLLLG